MGKTHSISLIIPVFELTEETKTTFISAIKSVEMQKTRPSELLLVVPSSDTTSKSILDSIDFGEVKDILTIVNNEGKTDFQSQFNFGVSKAKSEWVSLLEQDDQLSPIWFKNVQEYINAYQDVEIFLPIIVEVSENNQYITTTNEPCWAQSFSDELGVLTNDALLDYHNFSIDGFVIKKSTYEEFGGLKTNLHLTFVYEFLLRMTYKGAKTMVIPKMGYKHVNNRPNSLFRTLRETMTSDENKFWWTHARKDYFFDVDREIKYTNTEK